MNLDQQNLKTHVLIQRFHSGFEFDQIHTSNYLEDSGTGLTSSILVAEVGEPPDVAEPDGDGDAREEEVELVAPLPPRRALPLVTLHMDLGDLFTRLELNEVVLLVVRQWLGVLERDCFSRKVKSLDKVFIL